MNVNIGTKRAFGKTIPEPHLRGGVIFFPADIRTESLNRHPDEATETHYSYLWCEIVFRGQDISDPTWREKTALELKLKVLADLRWQKETGGITLPGGALMWTDRDTQVKLSAAKAEATADPQFAVRWKSMDGWIDLDATAIIAVANAVRDHVKACFEREDELTDLIAQDIMTDITTGWPI